MEENKRLADIRRIDQELDATFVKLARAEIDPTRILAVMGYFMMDLALMVAGDEFADMLLGGMRKQIETWNLEHRSDTARRC